MRSHELAKLLLARRDNDVMVRMPWDNDPSETGDPSDPDLFDTHWVNVEAVEYDAKLDRVIIQAETASGPAWGEE